MGISEWKDKFTPGTADYLGDNAGSAKKAGSWWWVDKLEKAKNQESKYWDKRREMTKLLMLKFGQNRELKELLLSTRGYELRHSGPRIDNEWGCCYTKYDGSHGYNLH